MASALTPFDTHDHAKCQTGVMSHAEALARSKGLRLTPVRRKTLEILLTEHRALGAYEVLERLNADGFGNQPPVAYRALGFLVENGLAHRIRRLNAFTACICPGERHRPIFLICRACDTVAEAAENTVQPALDEAAAAANFKIERANIEILGLCPSCQEKSE